VADFQPPEKTTVYYPADGFAFSGLAAPYGAGDTYATKPGNALLHAQKWNEAVVSWGQVGKVEPQAEEISYWLYETFDIPPNSTVREAVWEFTCSALGGTENVRWRTGILIPDGRYENQYRHAEHVSTGLDTNVRDTADAVISFAGLSSPTDDVEIREDRGLPEVGVKFTVNTAALPNNLILDHIRCALKKVGGARASDFNTHIEWYAWDDDPETQQAIFAAAPLATSSVVDWNSFSTSYATVTYSFTGADQLTLADGADYVYILKNASAGASYTSWRTEVEFAAALHTVITIGSGARLPYFGNSNYIADHELPNMHEEDLNVVNTAKFVDGTVFPSNSTNFDINHPTPTFIDTWTMGDSTISPTPDFTVALAAKLQSLFASAAYGSGGIESVHARLAAFTVSGIDTTLSNPDIDAENAALGAKLTITYTPPLIPDGITPGTGATPAIPFHPTETSIANAALALLGERRIDSLSDGSVLANMIAERFGDLRDSLLRMLPWNFATVRASLAASSTRPDWEFAWAYPLPGDFVRLLEVDDGTSRLPYMVEGQNIVTGISSPLAVTYTGRVTDPELMDPLYRDCLSALIAVDFAEAVTGSGKLKQVFTIFTERFMAAGVANGQEREPLRVIATEWQASRGRHEER